MVVEQDKYRTLIEQTKATRWAPEQSGNPNGRPVSSLTTLLKQYLDADDEKEKQAIVTELVSLAKSRGETGQVSALREIFDRIDGKVPDKYEIEDSEKLGASIAVGMFKELARLRSEAPERDSSTQIELTGD